MKILKVILLTLVSLGLLIGATMFLTGYFKPKPSGISIDSVPVSSVYINNRFAGKTPYKKMLEQDTISLKLIPDGITVEAYETEVNLTPGVESVVKYEFREVNEYSQGYVLSFDKDPAKGTSLVVITEPQNAQVFLDGAVKGLSPYKSSSITPSRHTLSIKLADYLERNLTINVQEGYRLSIFLKLGKNPPPTPSPTPEMTAKTYVEILDTPTGFLRVRTEAGTKGEEIAEVKPGSKYLFLEEDSVSGWYKIQYSEPKAGLPDGIQGWVSNQYSKKVEE